MTKLPKGWIELISTGRNNSEPHEPLYIASSAIALVATDKVPDFDKGHSVEKTRVAPSSSNLCSFFVKETPEEVMQKIKEAQADD